MIRIEMHRTKAMFGFEVQDSLGHKLQTDSSKDNGGEDSGFRPMQLLLGALASCSGIDLVSILQKQKQTLTDIKIIVEGERELGTIPSLWKNIQMHFELVGEIDIDKAKRAVELSVEKYCSVAETLRLAGCTISYTMEIVSEANFTK